MCICPPNPGLHSGDSNHFKSVSRMHANHVKTSGSLGRRYVCNNPISLSTGWLTGYCHVCNASRGWESRNLWQWDQSKCSMATVGSQGPALNLHIYMGTTTLITLVSLKVWHQSQHIISNLSCSPWYKPALDIVSPTEFWPNIIIFISQILRIISTII